MWLVAACRTPGADDPPAKWQVVFSDGSASVNYADAGGSTTKQGVASLTTCTPSDAGVTTCTGDDWQATFNPSTSSGWLWGPRTAGSIKLSCTGAEASAVCNEVAQASPAP
jgi:hypothetical protein